MRRSVQTYLKHQYLLTYHWGKCHAFPQSVQTQPYHLRSRRQWLLAYWQWLLPDFRAGEATVPLRPGGSVKVLLQLGFMCSVVWRELVFHPVSSTGCCHSLHAPVLWWPWRRRDWNGVLLLKYWISVEAKFGPLTCQWGKWKNVAHSYVHLEI